MDNRCIVCGKTINELGNDNPLTEEHIIPEALGNNTLIRCILCKSCNSLVGEKIDAPYVNSFTIQLLRKNYGIKGKNGIPNPFKEGVDENGKPIRLNENFVPQIVPYVETTNEGWIVHAPTRKEAKKIINEKMERNNATPEKIKQVLERVDQLESEHYSPSICYNKKIDLKKTKLAVLKIAYEYTFSKLGKTYYSDERAIEVRNILKSAIEGKMDEKEYKSIAVVPAPEKFKRMLDEIKKTVEPCHMMLLQETSENCLVAFISLFCEPSESYLALVSNNANAYNKNFDVDMIKIK